MKNRAFFWGWLFLIPLCFKAPAQDLLDLLEEEPVREFTMATFKTGRIINGHSIENPPPGELMFIIGHRFGKLNDGVYELFGIDQASARYGLEYGLHERLAVGFGRSTYSKNYDLFIKSKLFRQSSGVKVVPVSVSYFTSVSAFSTHWPDESRVNYFTSRLSFTHQLLIARKFNSSFSAQFIPGLIHKNLVLTEKDKNDIFYIGAGSRMKLSSRISLNAEYYYVFPNQIMQDRNNSLSIGFDIETGGHVFQLHFTNSLALYETAFVSETTGDWLKGDIHFGFNITRMFTLTHIAYKKL